MYIGVDLGGTSVKVGLVDNNKLVEMRTSETGRDKSPHDLVADIVRLSKEVMDEYNIDEGYVGSIGIGCPGLVHPKQGIIIKTSNFDFENFHIKNEIKKSLDLDVYVENDANVAALGEATVGAAKGKSSAVVVTIGTGVGGGIVIDGKIFSGAFAGAGEVGHQIIKFDDHMTCGCGRAGCWEQYASATALINQAKAVASHKMIEIAGGYDNIEAKTVFDAADQGDEVAWQVLNKYFDYLAIGLTNLINIIQPEVIVLGGGISAQKDKLVAPVVERVQAQMYGGLKLETSIVAATLGNSAGIIGAALVGPSKKSI
ncbi:MAG: glucokinase [Epulopiscium sp. Nele67-Bin002]|nr:MAG: glucokinase [Epulopiscium sp. Nuni2H_MBin001]OON91682.1 MAG: glucokinase [Epulopiscium sp. Nele67-Bin002]OON93731.1 MAG: glucokinase [Epulopiscium sp. Nele67-Bin001]